MLFSSDRGFTYRQSVSHGSNGDGRTGVLTSTLLAQCHHMCHQGLMPVVKNGTISVQYYRDPVIRECSWRVKVALNATDDGLFNVYKVDASRSE